MKRLLLFLALCLSCTTLHQPPDLSVRARQQEIIARDLGWLFDSLPIVRFPPPFIYGMWRLQVEACTGVRKDGWPRLFIAPYSTFGAGYMAAYFSDADAIVFGLGNETRGAVVRHELIHYLLSPDSSHYPRYFSTDPTIGQCAPYLTEG